LQAHVSLPRSRGQPGKPAFLLNLPQIHHSCRLRPKRSQCVIAGVATNDDDPGLPVVYATDQGALYVAAAMAAITRGWQRV
jgi:hypothetical protein